MGFHRPIQANDGDWGNVGPAVPEGPGAYIWVRPCDRSMTLPLTLGAQGAGNKEPRGGGVK